MLPPLMEAPRSYRARVRVNVPFRTLRAVNGTTRTEASGRDAALDIEDVHEVLDIET